MQNRCKKMKNGNFVRQALTSIWCLSSRVIIPFFCLAACQPATVQLENKVRLTKSYMKVAQINNGQTNKNNDQIKTKEENQRVVKFAPPRSIIVIEEPNETQSPYQDQPLKDAYVVQPIDQKMLEQKTAEEIATATAVMNSITWQFQAGEKETKTIDPVIPSDQDVSLSEDALETAFALLSNRGTRTSMICF